MQIQQAVVYGIEMHGKHRRTLAAVFRDPVSGTLDWAAVEGLLIAAGARVIEGRGSRVRFEKDGEIDTFHRPIQPGRQSDIRYAPPVRSWKESESRHDQHDDIQGLLRPYRL